MPTFEQLEELACRARKALYACFMAMEKCNARKEAWDEDEYEVFVAWENRGKAGEEPPHAMTGRFYLTRDEIYKCQQPLQSFVGNYSEYDVGRMIPQYHDIAAICDKIEAGFLHSLFHDAVVTNA